MEKYIVYSTWFHEKGLRPAEEMREGMRKMLNHIPLQKMLYGGKWMIIITNLLQSTLLRMQLKNIELSWSNFAKTVHTSIQ